MAERWIDAVSRAMATDGTRRGVVKAVTGGALSGFLATHASDRTAAKDKNKGKGKGEGKGKGNEQARGQGEGRGREKVTICHNGQTITVAEPAVEAHLNHGDTRGACPTGEAAPDERVVVRIPSFQVEVVCEAAADGTGTRCTFTGRDVDRTGDVRRVVVPAAEVCAEIAGGEYEPIAAEPAAGGGGYQSTGGDAVVTLVLAGDVSAGGTASYWVETDDGSFPAPGPGLRCEEAADVAEEAAEPEQLSDTTGAVVVHAYGCDVAAPDAEINWYEECTHAMADLTFTLSMIDGEESPEEQTGATDDSGLLRFGPLAPGTYDLDAVDAAWCHAESNGVDDDGNLIVEAGQRCHVWAFVCAEETGTPEAEADG